MKISSIKTYPLKGGSWVAGASVVLDNSICLRSMVLRKKVGGEDMCLDMPSFKNGAGEYREYYNPITKDVRDMLSGAVLDQVAAMQENPDNHSATFEVESHVPEISEVSIFRLEGNGPAKALASIVVDGGLAIRKLCILQSTVDESLFVGMPLIQIHNGFRLAVCNPMNHECRKAITDAVLAEYQAQL